jgi:hypothetical protein
MSNSSQSHLFWGSTSPLAALSGGGLLIMASVRFSYALIVSISLFWVYCLSILVLRAASRILPRQGIVPVQTFLASFIAGLFLLILWILSPITALEIFFIVSFVPLFCVSSGILERIAPLDDIGDALVRAVNEAAVLSLLMLAFALIREPLGLLSLSVPGGSRGIVFLFSGKGESLLPAHLIAGSSGALILLGYGLGLYRYYRGIYAPRELNI